MPAQRTRDIPLTVSTEVSPLTIISPQPRTFAYPVIDSPYSSPCHSPCEEDKHTIKRRKSSCDTVTDRRPRKGDEDYIKRPENAFILFRRKCCEDRQAMATISPIDGPAKKQRQADLSKTISQQWKSLSVEERQHWEDLAKEKKKEHEQLHPNYVYRPQRSNKDNARAKPRKPKSIRGEHEHEQNDSVSFVLPVPTSSSNPFTRRLHGRSASAPEPQPYQSIQIPNVYMPSCPTSPSLMPMIQRRSSHPDHQGFEGTFDYLPAQQMLYPGQLEVPLSTAEFFQGMYNRASLSINTSYPLPAHTLVSPTLSSGPNSPNAGPFTPTSALIPDPQFYPGVNVFSEQAMQFPIQPAYSWENTSIWSSQEEANSILLGEDFDINAIPSVELGVPKFGDDFCNLDWNAVGLACSAQQESIPSQSMGGFEDLFGIEDVLSGQGF